MSKQFDPSFIDGKWTILQQLEAIKKWLYDHELLFDNATYNSLVDNINSVLELGQKIETTLSLSQDNKNDIIRLQNQIYTIDGDLREIYESLTTLRTDIDDTLSLAHTNEQDIALAEADIIDINNRLETILLSIQGNTDNITTLYSEINRISMLADTNQTNIANIDAKCLKTPLAPPNEVNLVAIDINNSQINIPLSELKQEYLHTIKITDSSTFEYEIYFNINSHLSSTFSLNNFLNKGFISANGYVISENGSYHIYGFELIKQGLTVNEIIIYLFQDQTFATSIVRPLNSVQLTDNFRGL